MCSTKLHGFGAIPIYSSTLTKNNHFVKSRYIYVCIHKHTHTRTHAHTHPYIRASVTKGMFAATKRYYPLVCQNRYLRTISSMVQPFFSMSFIR
jgi:hypothetical protein